LFPNAKPTVASFQKPANNSRQQSKWKILILIRFKRIVIALPQFQLTWRLWRDSVTGMGRLNHL
jgi:hypothetical protein